MYCGWYNFGMKTLSAYVFTFLCKVMLEVVIKKCNFYLQPTENKRITSLKRYLRLAGIHTVTYTKVLQNCRSNKAKIESLLDLLRKEGLKGAYAVIVAQVVFVTTEFVSSEVFTVVKINCGFLDHGIM
jgi:hypothetical protein